MVFEHKCVLAVYEQNHPRMKKIHSVFFYNLNKSYALPQTSCSWDSALSDVERETGVWLTVWLWPRPRPRWSVHTILHCFKDSR